ncbi:hypothetical protein PGB90_009493 [Kerria lacca]
MSTQRIGKWNVRGLAIIYSNRAERAVKAERSDCKKNPKLNFAYSTKRWREPRAEYNARKRSKQEGQRKIGNKMDGLHPNPDEIGCKCKGSSRSSEPRGVEGCRWKSGRVLIVDHDFKNHENQADII